MNSYAAIIIEAGDLPRMAASGRPIRDANREGEAARRLRIAAQAGPQRARQWQARDAEDEAV